VEDGGDRLRLGVVEWEQPGGHVEGRGDDHGAGAQLGALDWSERRGVRVLRGIVVGYALLAAVTAVVSLL
jgi:hypothetical protein